MADLESLVNVESLDWSDAAGSRNPKKVMREFHPRRPDVEVLPGQLGLNTVAVCRQNDGLRRFAADTSGKLKPGQTLLLYVEPDHLTSCHTYFGLVMRFEIKTTLIDASNTTVATQISDPLQLTVRQPGELIYATVNMVVPAALKPGSCQRQVELKDTAPELSRTAMAEISLEF